MQPSGTSYWYRIDHRPTINLVRPQYYGPRTAIGSTAITSKHVRDGSFFGFQTWEPAMDFRHGNLLWISDTGTCYGFQTREPAMDFRHGNLLWISDTGTCYGFQTWEPAMDFRHGNLLAKSRRFYPGIAFFMAHDNSFITTAW
ncbi:hypothetical protein E6O75_ATG02318 [Venturia nashicola]|uniref:Uncharacterized protein n=1 Tax=Venturia nashicola TaxID=86259 RepID=A0A4Z1PM43_9PEZI|nr:hypothetical protein E6O75_ATG02318 [Venturia nashicola]